MIVFGEASAKLRGERFPGAPKRNKNPFSNRASSARSMKDGKNTEGASRFIISKEKSGKNHPMMKEKKERIHFPLKEGMVWFSLSASYITHRLRKAWLPEGLLQSL